MQQQDIVFPTEGFTCKYPGLPDHSRLEIFRHMTLEKDAMPWLEPFATDNVVR